METEDLNSDSHTCTSAFLVQPSPSPSLHHLFIYWFSFVVVVIVVYVTQAGLDPTVFLPPPPEWQVYTTEPDLSFLLTFSVPFGGHLSVLKAMAVS